jgi:hypothetical protein
MTSVYKSIAHVAYKILRYFGVAYSDYPNNFWSVLELVEVDDVGILIK